MHRKGGQSALLERRIADAAKYGARHTVAETGVPQQGQPAPSYRNILGCGFAVAYVRAELDPAGVARGGRSGTRSSCSFACHQLLTCAAIRRLARLAHEGG